MSAGVRRDGMARKRIWEKRGVTCALYYVRRYQFIFASMPLEWRNSGGSGSTTGKVIVSSLAFYVAMRLNWTLDMAQVE
jgi:hypothetical protein